MTTSATGLSIVPHTVDELRDVLRESAAASTPVSLTGAGTWRDAGVPRVADRSLSLRALSGIIAYVPGDLTITTWAGTSLAELSHATAAHAQWLALDPAGDRMGTIGATVATASAGPLAHAFGTPRDLVLGLDAITGYGEQVRPGGRVVKNVAGFDLVRLYTGSWGTLGPITAVTLRLRALPVHDVTLVVPVAGHASLPALIADLRRHTLSLMACEWIDGATARALDISDSGADVILVRIGGNDAFVRGQRAAIERHVSVTSCDAGVWGKLALLDHDATAVVRFSGGVSTLPERIARVRMALAESDPHGSASASLHATVSRGIVRVVVTGDATLLRTLLQGQVTGEHRIPERLPTEWWRTEPDPFEGGLAGRIRAAFDPSAICNRRATNDA